MREICIEQEALANVPTITLSLCCAVLPLTLSGQWAESNQRDHGTARINLINTVKMVGLLMESFLLGGFLFVS